jgi:Holliday junction DNA helicase RuvA
LSTLPASEIAEAVDAGDDSRFRVVPGIGQKTASLIIVSLTGKMPQASNSESADLTDALTGLGWAQSAARDVARDVIRDTPNASLAVRLKIALASLGGNS